jgi:hypothetical protein
MTFSPLNRLVPWDITSRDTYQMETDPTCSVHLVCAGARCSVDTVSATLLVCTRLFQTHQNALFDKYAPKKYPRDKEDAWDALRLGEREGCTRTLILPLLPITRSDWSERKGLSSLFDAVHADAQKPSRIFLFRDTFAATQHSLASSGRLVLSFVQNPDPFLINPRSCSQSRSRDKTQWVVSTSRGADEGVACVVVDNGTCSRDDVKMMPGQVWFWDNTQSITSTALNTVVFPSASSILTSFPRLCRLSLFGILVGTAGLSRTTPSDSKARKALCAFISDSTFMIAGDVYRRLDEQRQASLVSVPVPSGIHMFRHVFRSHHASVSTLPSSWVCTEEWRGGEKKFADDMCRLSGGDVWYQIIEFAPNPTGTSPSSSDKGAAPGMISIVVCAAHDSLMTPVRKMIGQTLGATLAVSTESKLTLRYSRLVVPAQKFARVMAGTPHGIWGHIIRGITPTISPPPQMPLPRPELETGSPRCAPGFTLALADVEINPEEDLP